MNGWVERSDEEIVTAWEIWAKNSMEPDKPIVYITETRMGYSPMGLANALRTLLDTGGQDNSWKSDLLWLQFIQAAREDAQMKNYDIVEKITQQRR